MNPYPLLNSWICLLLQGHLHNMTIRTRKWTFVPLIHRPIQVCQMSQQCPLCQESDPGPGKALRHPASNLSSACKNLTVLTIMGHYLIECLLIWACCTYPHVDIQVTHLRCLFFLSFSWVLYDFNLYLYWWYSFDHFIKKLSVRLFHCKVFFPFVLKIFYKNYFETM